MIQVGKDCTGCAACIDICPKGCIRMEEDDRLGHIYPVVDKESCVDCHLCENVCPVDNAEFISPDYVKAYVGKGSAEEVFSSASGGGLAILSRSLIDKGFVVYGVRYDHDLSVIHDRATTVEECEAFRKSKYVQSDTNHCYRRIGEDLKQGRKVFFTGVSCQCAALMNFLRQRHIPTDNLLTANILCHGVPSPKMFESYREEQKQLFGRKTIGFQFKNKRAFKGEINSRTAYIEYEDGSSRIVGIKEDPFLSFYYHRIGYRPSCGSCRFTTKQRVSDFTFADAWNYDKVDPSYDPLSGVSLILVNTDKASLYFEDVRDALNVKSISKEWALNSQGLFNHPTSLHPRDEEFYALFEELGFSGAVFKLTKLSLFKRVKRKVYALINNVMNTQ
ncbi:Coenzyme F420 hydrogenase/dehydrogenase, beta subunit C-terminal domain [Parabacteroides distasonis]|nr:Coenzyme F420 hydrogenase/dehydrogenase, beta subunit C-terminal domain [Parabacteroides distasonis]